MASCRPALLDSTTEVLVVPNVPGGRRLGLHQQRPTPRRPLTGPGRGAQAVLLDQPAAALGVAQRQDRPLVRRLRPTTSASLGRGTAAQGRRPELHRHRATRARTKVSFMVLGDPGEGDDSQYQVLRPLEGGPRRDRLHIHRQRRHLPGRRRPRLPRPVLLALPRATRADLRDPREPRLVRRPARLHDPALRCGPGPAPAGARVAESLEARVPRPRWREPSEAMQEQLEEMRKHPARALGPARPVLRDRAEGARPRRHRHGHSVGNRRRAGRMAQEGVAAPEGQDPHDREAARRRRRPQALPDRRLGRHRQRDRREPGQPLHRGHRRRHPQLPALPRAAQGRAGRPAHRQRRRRAPTRRRRTRFPRRPSRPAGATRPTSAATRGGATPSPPTRSCSTASSPSTSPSRTRWLRR